MSSGNTTSLKACDKASRTPGAALYDAYAPAVWNAVSRRLGPYSADVADVVQETFLAAASTARNFDRTQGTLWSWLSGIAYHHVAQYFRKQQRQSRIVQAVEVLGPQHERVMAWLEHRDSAPLDVLVTAEMAYRSEPRSPASRKTTRIC